MPRVSVAEYVENLRAIAGLARRHGGRVILLGPPVNLFSYPVRSRGAAFEDASHERAERILGLARDGRIEEARGEGKAWLEEEPGNHIALWVGGYLKFRGGSPREGVRLLEESLSRHPYPYSAPERYRSALRKLAGEEKVPAADVNAILGREARGRQPAAMYLDHCHPTAEGHSAIAAALERTLAELAPDCP